MELGWSSASVSADRQQAGSRAISLLDINPWMSANTHKLNSETAKKLPLNMQALFKVIRYACYSLWWKPNCTHCCVEPAGHTSLLENHAICILKVPQYYFFLGYKTNVDFHMIHFFLCARKAPALLWPKAMSLFPCQCCDCDIWWLYETSPENTSSYCLPCFWCQLLKKGSSL